MYICPTCNKEFDTEIAITQHSLKCWREHNPNHKSKPAPRSENIVNREINDDVINFFKGISNARSNA